ncbi:MAG: hypothetical protein LC623_06675 [Halobacteriales archaeon]|nr:hypothetical protein [Halobacteriales archaeon]
MAAKTASKKAAKAAPKKAPAKKAAAKRAAPPAASAQGQEAHAKAVERKLAQAEHQHQDPRGPAHQSNPAAQAHGNDPRKDQGAIKNRGVPRMNKIVNWFRRGQGR